MLVNLPNHLSSHMASSVSHVSVEIGEYVSALGIRQECVVGGEGEGEGLEGIFDSLETVEDM